MTYQLLPAFSAYSGSRKPKILLVGEAWGQHEQELKKPFVGESGKELFLMLGEAIPVASELHNEIVSLHRYGLAWTKRREEWFEAAGIGMTNVFNLRPPNNDLTSLCCTKLELKGLDYAHPALSKGKYLRPEFLPEFTRLEQELSSLRPNLVVALGNTACWALLGSTNIGSIRGAVATATRGYKTLPTYHPAGVMRQWNWRPIVVADLMKAWRECQFPEIRRPARRVLVNPTIDEIIHWTHETLQNPPKLLAPDIETHAKQISCIGFARARDDALVIPFMRVNCQSYWQTREEEWVAWDCVNKLLSSSIPKLFQNGMYDLQYINKMGFRVNNCTEDSMLLHHSLYPEMLKGLGFMGSIYTSEPSWKLMRRHRPDTEKADE